MIMKGREFKSKELTRVCSFYAGEGHFLSTVLTYLIDKVKKGSKVLLFIEEETREKLPKAISNIDPYLKYENWQEHVVLYPLKAVCRITQEGHFAYHIKSMIELIGPSCSEEGLIICIQKANSLDDNLIKQIEELLPSLMVPVYMVNCYEFTADKEFMLKTLSQHKYILNTKGINEIGKIYPGINIKVLA